jgi:hypothetical protein
LQDTTFFEQMHFGDRKGGRQTNYNKVYERASQSAASHTSALEVPDLSDDEGAQAEEAQAEQSDEEPQAVVSDVTHAGSVANAQGCFPVPPLLGQAS